MNASSSSTEPPSSSNVQCNGFHGSVRSLSGEDEGCCGGRALLPTDMELGEVLRGDFSAGSELREVLLVARSKTGHGRMQSCPCRCSGLHVGEGSSERMGRQKEDGRSHVRHVRCRRNVRGLAQFCCLKQACTDVGSFWNAKYLQSRVVKGGNVAVLVATVQSILPNYVQDCGVFWEKADRHGLGLPGWGTLAQPKSAGA